MHATRSLSVVGIAAVLNSLIVSKSWHILRVTPLTGADFKQLRSAAIQFLRQSIFPVIPWNVWTLSKAQGGLGVIDIQLKFLLFTFVGSNLCSLCTNRPLIIIRSLICSVFMLKMSFNVFIIMFPFFSLVLGLKIYGINNILKGPCTHTQYFIISQYYHHLLH